MNARFRRLAEGECDMHEISITDIGPVIGSHCGPGTLAVFFVSKKR